MYSASGAAFTTVWLLTGCSLLVVLVVIYSFYYLTTITPLFPLTIWGAALRLDRGSRPQRKGVPYRLYPFPIWRGVTYRYIPIPLACYPYRGIRLPRWWFVPLTGSELPPVATLPEVSVSVYES